MDECLKGQPFLQPEQHLSRSVTDPKPNQDTEETQLPSYDEAVTSIRSGKQSLRADVQRQIRDELLNLAGSFKAVQTMHCEKLLSNNQRVLEALLQEIRLFLNDYIKSVLPKATLILVPADIIPENSVEALDDLRSRDDFGRLVQVRIGGDGKGGSWEGVDMTKGLADCLQPSDKRIWKPASEPISQEAAIARKSRSSLWKKSSLVAKEERVSEKALQSAKVGRELPEVEMNVKAEEIIFRVETPFGSYETAKVWGLVIKIHIKAESIGEH